MCIIYVFSLEVKYAYYTLIASDLKALLNKTTTTAAACYWQWSNGCTKRNDLFCCYRAWDHVLGLWCLVVAGGRVTSRRCARAVSSFAVSWTNPPPTDVNLAIIAIICITIVPTVGCNRASNYLLFSKVNTHSIRTQLYLSIELRHSQNITKSNQRKVSANIFKYFVLIRLSYC